MFIQFVSVGNVIRIIRAWQNSCNEAAQNECLRFNTYTIAIFVIFSMQLNGELPVIDESMPDFSIYDDDDESGLPIEKSELSSCLFDFFWLYGNDYKMKDQVISVRTGQWLESSNLGDSMSDWSNCSMLTEDIIDSGRNVTAKVTRDEALMFQKMCKTFALEVACDALAAHALEWC